MVESRVTHFPTMTADVYSIRKYLKKSSTRFIKKITIIIVIITLKKMKKTVWRTFSKNLFLIEVFRVDHLFFKQNSELLTFFT